MIGFPELALMLGLLAVFIFEVTMLVNVWQSSRTTGKKLLWTVLLFAFYPIGGIIYFFGFRQKAQPQTQDASA